MVTQKNPDCRMTIPFSCRMSHVGCRGLCLPRSSGLADGGPTVLEQLEPVVYSTPLVGVWGGALWTVTGGLVTASS